MVSSWILLLVSAGYAALLFAVAWWGDRRPLYPKRPWLRPVVYSLALAVYCSSWTFYGAVGSAVRHGIGYLPIYLGPLLLLLFGWRIIERLALIARSQNTVSIADFISSRYGRSRRLAALVAVIALVGVLPYLALQYKAVAMSLQVLSGQSSAGAPFYEDPELYVALLMALFATLFGTRQVDATEHRHGMMLAIALESIVKLLAIIAVGVFAYVWLSAHEAGQVLHSARTLFQNTPPVGFISQTVLSFLALVCLPRQFHVAVLECSDVGDIRKARWLFGLYLVLISAMVVPIAAAGVALFDGGDVAGDSIVLALPLTYNHTALALVAYVGGFSAATGMVIVSSIALATMISNDLVMPLLLRRRGHQAAGADVASQVLWIRRIAILLLALIAYGYYRTSRNDSTLASYGLMAFVAVAQFAPGVIGGLYWRGASRKGVEAGMVLGFATWVYTLLLPALTQSGWLGSAWLHDGLFGIAWLRPQHLFGLRSWDPLAHGMFWSLLVNVGTLMLVSARWRPGLDEQLRAAPFLEPYAQRPVVAGDWLGQVHLVDLQALAERMVGQRHARRAFAEQAQLLGREPPPNAVADRAWVQFTERPACRFDRRGLRAPGADQPAARLGHGSGRSGGGSRSGGSGTALQPRDFVHDAGEHQRRSQRGRCLDVFGRVESALPTPVRISRRHALRGPSGGGSDSLQRRARPTGG